MDHGSRSFQHERYANMADLNFTSDLICKKNHLEKGYYNTCYSKLKFELNLNSNRSKVFELWGIDDVDIKYTIRVILCKKNHVKQNTTTQVIAVQI